MVVCPLQFPHTSPGLAGGDVCAEHRGVVLPGLRLEPTDEELPPCRGGFRRLSFRCSLPELSPMLRLNPAALVLPGRRLPVSNSLHRRDPRSRHCSLARDPCQLQRAGAQHRRTRREVVLDSSTSVPLPLQGYSPLVLVIAEDVRNVHPDLRRVERGKALPVGRRDLLHRLRCEGLPTRNKLRDDALGWTAGVGDGGDVGGGRLGIGGVHRSLVGVSRGRGRGGGAWSGEWWRWDVQGVAGRQAGEWDRVSRRGSGP